MAMSQEILELVKAVDQLQSVDGEDLELLQKVADRYFAQSDASQHLDVWFRLYERFPDDDGYGVFWTILHGIESQAGSGDSVVRSVQRAPTHFSLLMVNRMLNGGTSSVNGTNLLELLNHVASNEQISPSVRDDAISFVEHQRDRA
jgi:hypothetical protein